MGLTLQKECFPWMVIPRQALLLNLHSMPVMLHPRNSFCPSLLCFLIQEMRAVQTAIRGQEDILQVGWMQHGHVNANPPVRLAGA